MATMLSITNPKDKVVIFSPFYENYGADTILSGAEPIYVPLVPPDFTFSIEQLENAFKQGAKALILCNPSNPCGKVFTFEELTAIADVVKKYDAYVVTDEVYEHIVYAPNKHIYMQALDGMRERTIVCNSLSKTYSITGWRLGYACAPHNIMEQMIKLHQFAIMCAPTTSQYAAVDALKNSDEDVKRMRESYDQRRRYLLHAFREMGMDCFEPLGAFYIFPSIRRFGMSSDDFAMELLKAERVAVVPGTAFGQAGEGHLRVSYAYSLKSLKEALGRIERFVNTLDSRER